MSVKIVVGKVGYGKTYSAIDRFCAAVKNNEGAFSNESCFFIAPEQFCVDIESKILSKVTGILSSEVISFNRIVYRVLSKYGKVKNNPVESYGKAMILVHCLKKLEGKLSYFVDIPDKPRSAQKLLETLTECRKYNIDSKKLDELSENLSGDMQKAKIKDISLILDEYNSYFNDEIVDVQLLYKTAAEIIEQETTEIDNSYIVIDSFTGFTENELLIIKAFAKKAKNLVITLNRDLDSKTVYAIANDTYKRVTDYLKFNGFTYEEEQLVDESNTRISNNEVIKFIGQNFAKTFPGKSDCNVSDKLMLYSCKNFYEEVKCLRKNIVEYVQKGYNYKDIAVVIPSVDESAYMIENQLNEASIPYYIDKKTEISGHVAFRFIYSFIKIITNDLNEKDLISLLKTNLYKPEVYDIKDVYLLEKNLIKFSVGSKKSIERYISYTNKKDVDNSLISEIYKLFYEPDGFVDRAKKCKTVADSTKLIYDFAVVSNLENSLCCSKQSDEFIRVWNSFVDILKSADTILGEIKVNGYKKLFSFVANLFMNAAENLELGFIPKTNNLVQIGNISRSRYLDKKILFILGANDGNFPKSAKDKGFIGDSEREVLDKINAPIGYGSYFRTLLNSFNVYSLLTMPTDVLSISYSTQGGSGDELRPSPAVLKLKKLFPNLETIHFNSFVFEDDENHFDESVIIDNKINKKLLKIGDCFKTSFSSLEIYTKCPYEYFLSKEINLQEFRTIDVDSLKAGSFFHYLLEKTVKQASNSDIKTVGRDKWRELVSSAFEEYKTLNENDEFRFAIENSQRNNVLIERIIDFAETEGIKLSEYAEKTDFTPILEELDFGMDEHSILPGAIFKCNGFDTIIRGTIDRIDMRIVDGKEQLAIVDYKSGDKDVKDKSIENGVLLQLLIYQKAIKEGMNGELAKLIVKDASVASLSFYLFGKSAVSDTSKKHIFAEVVNEELGNVNGFSQKPNVKNFSQLQSDMEKSITDMTNSIANGNFDIVPKADKDACMYCKFNSVCKFDKRKENTENEN